MKLRVGFVLLLTAMAAAFVSGAGAPKSAPAFELADRAGNNHRLENGKPALVHFWASWCAPCLEELPELAKFAKSLASEAPSLKTYLVSVDTNWNDAQKIIKTVPDGGDNLIFLLDPEARTSDQFGTYQYPETYLVTADQKMLNKWIGPQQWNKKPEFRKVVLSHIKPEQTQKPAIGH